MMEKDRKKLIIIAVVFSFIALSLIVLTFIMFTSGSGRGEEIEANITPEAFQSTPENPYDTSLIEDRESEKEELDEFIVSMLEERAVANIQSGYWKDALREIEDHAETHSFYKEPLAEKLLAFQVDLTVMTQMSQVDPNMYRDLFRSYEAPETFLASMVYYPYSVKKSGFISSDSLVPTTETNNVVIRDLESYENDELLDKLNRMYQDQYDSLWKQSFTVDGNELLAYYAKRNNNTWMVYKIVSKEDVYYMTVHEWQEILD